MPFGSREFKDFAYEWGIKTTTSSPTYAQSNGLAKICVQTLKGLFKKADEDGRDPYLALLEYRNTPVSGLPHTVTDVDEQIAPIKPANKADIAATECGRCTR